MTGIAPLAPTASELFPQELLALLVPLPKDE